MASKAPMPSACAAPAEIPSGLDVFRTIPYALILPELVSQTPSNVSFITTFKLFITFIKSDTLFNRGLLPPGVYITYIQEMEQQPIPAPIISVTCSAPHTFVISACYGFIGNHKHFNPAKETLRYNRFLCRCLCYLLLDQKLQVLRVLICLALFSVGYVLKCSHPFHNLV